jgi:hypothetical protein
MANKESFKIKMSQSTQKEQYNTVTKSEKRAYPIPLVSPAPRKI